MVMHADLLIALVIAGLASYRITRLLIIDSLFAGTRTKIRRRIARDALWAEKLDELLSCAYCMGGWVSFAVWLAVRTQLEHPGGVVMAVVMWMAVAAVQATLQHLDVAAH